MTYDLLKELLGVLVPHRYGDRSCIRLPRWVRRPSGALYHQDNILLFESCSIRFEHLNAINSAFVYVIFMITLMTLGPTNSRMLCEVYPKHAKKLITDSATGIYVPLIVSRRSPRI